MSSRLSSVAMVIHLNAGSLSQLRDGLIGGINGQRNRLWLYSGTHWTSTDVPNCVQAYGAKGISALKADSARYGKTEDENDLKLSNGDRLLKQFSEKEKNRDVVA